METKFAERTLEQMLSEVADKLWESMQEDGLVRGQFDESQKTE